MFDTFRSMWVRVGRWPRLIAAATCLLLAALSAVGSARERAAARTPQTVVVVVAARAVAAGRVLRAGDLRIEHWPVSVHPPWTPPDPHSLVGRRSAGALTAREPVTSARVLGSGVATGLPAGLGAVPVPIDGGRVGDYVRVGDHVDVLAGPPADTGVDGHDPAGATLVAGDVPVLGVLPGVSGEATVVVIAADRATALRVTGRGSGSFTLVVISP